MTALRLCEEGLKVALIERGPRFNPAKDYIQNYPDWDRRKDSLEESWRSEQTIDPTYRTPIAGTRLKRSPLLYSRVQGVGGSTLHYQGEAHRFAEHAFRTKSLFDWGLDWPIRYKDLESYYEQAEKLLGVAGKPGNPFKPKRGAFPTPAHPLSQRSKLLKESANELGFDLLENMLALPSESFGGRTPCQHSGGCNFGCVFGAKSSVDQAIIPLAEKTGNLTLFAKTRAIDLVFDDHGRISGVQLISENNKSQLRAKCYVLATGAIETPRIMLSSRSSLHPNGFANSQDQVGRYFMETVTATATPREPLSFDNYLGPPLDSRVWDFCFPKDRLTGGFVLGSTGYLYPAVGPSRQANKIQGVGLAHKYKMRETFGRSFSIFGIAEQEPVSSNRLWLSDNKDSAGVVKVNVHNEYSKRDQHTLDVMSDILGDWISATPGLTLGTQTTSLVKSAATHVAGTCRMGNDPKSSVVDSFGKVHGQENCYITDGSVMPTQGAGDSPSLTIQALALRTADKIANDIKTALTS